MGQQLRGRAQTSGTYQKRTRAGGRMGALGALAVIMLALLTSGVAANVNMTVYLNSAKVTPPLSGTPLAQGSIHLSFPDNIDPLSSTTPLPIYIDNLQLDASIAQPITAVRLFAGGVRTASLSPLVDFGVKTALPISGSVQVPPAVFRSILADPANFYISVYNGAYQDTGILRGQLPSLVVRVPVDTNKELPAVKTAANGTVVLTFDEDAICLSDLELNLPANQTINAAHIHLGGPTEVGPVSVGFPLTNQLTQPACTAVDPNTVRAIMANLSQYYVNLHDVENANGLLRNQISAGVAAVGLDSKEEAPAVIGGGVGRVLINVLGSNTICYWGLSVFGLQIPAGLTIAAGSPSQNGPPLVSFAADNRPVFPTAGCLIVPDHGIVNQVLNPGGNHYVNLLTTDHPTGAARGQLPPQGRVSASLLNQLLPLAPTAATSSDGISGTVVILIVALCAAAAAFLCAAIAGYFISRRRSKAAPVDHTALAKKWFDWTPAQEALPAKAIPSPPSSSRWTPPLNQSVVIDMPEGARHVGHLRVSKEYDPSSRSSDRSEEKSPLDRSNGSDRATSQEQAQTSGAHNSSTQSNMGQSVAFGGDFASSRSFTLREILVATDYFNEKGELGGGGFGKVYRGVLDDGSLIAVKRMKKESKQGMREFINEVRLLGRLKDPSLVRLVGFCATDEEQLLCYEYMPNGNLAQHLRGARKPLSWRMRLEVAIGAAKGLDHLHVIASPPVIHRDVKSSNILLDEDWNAKVADFGLSKAALTNACQPASSTFVRGTPGYFDPEYYEGQRLTENSDVYSFGVVLLEMLTGKKPIDQTLPSAEGSLAKWARPHLLDPERVLSIVDPRIQGSMTRASVLKVAALAHQCISLQGEDRPSMNEVVLRLYEATSS